MNAQTQTPNKSSSTMSRLNPLSHTAPAALLRGGPLRKMARGLVIFTPALGALATTAAVAKNILTPRPAAL